MAGPVLKWTENWVEEILSQSLRAGSHLRLLLSKPPHTDL